MIDAPSPDDTGMNRQTKRFLIGFGLLCLLLLYVQSGNAEPQPSAQPSPPPTQSSADGDSELVERITEGVVLNGNLWLLGTSGLVYLNLADESRKLLIYATALPFVLLIPIFLCVCNGALPVNTPLSAAGKNWVWSRRSMGRERRAAAC